MVFLWTYTALTLAVTLLWFVLIGFGSVKRDGLYGVVMSMLVIALVWWLVVIMVVLGGLLTVLFALFPARESVA